MALTPQQQAALVADIALGPFAGSLNNSDTAFDLAVYYDQPSPTTFWVWRESVTTREIMLNGFDWVRVDNATVGKARIWDWMKAEGSINPAQANIRAGIIEAWSGVANDAMRLSIFGHCQQQATRCQRLFATGAGTSTTNAGTGPGTPAVFKLTPDDVFAARAAG